MTDSSQKSFPYIFSGPLEDKKKKDFSAIVVPIDATLDSTLNWSSSKKMAQECLKEGFQIIWDLDFGLFNQLPLPLSDMSQYKSLGLALDHFFENILSDFKESTLGMIIYKGSCDFNHKWPFCNDQIFNLRSWILDQFGNEHTFINQSAIPCKNLMQLDLKVLNSNEFGKNLLRTYCMRAALDYLSMLTAHFESDLLPYTLLDAKEVASGTHLFQLLDQEDFDFLQLGLKNAPFECPHAIGWESKPFPNGFLGKEYQAYQPPLIDVTIGLVIPSNPIYDPEKLKLYDELYEKLKTHFPVKRISERTLTIDWQGLEDLVVVDIDSHSLRKLEGFVAAGGRVVNKGQPLGLNNEISLASFYKSLEVS